MSGGEGEQRLRDIAALADEAEGIRQGLEDEAAGRVHPLKEVMDGIRKKHGFGLMLEPDIASKPKI